MRFGTLEGMSGVNVEIIRNMYDYVCAAEALGVYPSGPLINAPLFDQESPPSDA